MAQDLLTPSLSKTRSAAIYSSNAMMAAAFFGGGFATVALAVTNSKLLGRLRSDAVWLALGAVFSAAAVAGAVYYFGYVVEDEGATRNVRLVNRGAGLALWLGYFALHKPYLKAMQTAGIDPRNPYALVAAYCVLAIVLSVGISAGVSTIFGVAGANS